MTTSTTTNTSAATSDYWNDHYTGACFLNNLRLVETRQEPFLSLDVHVKQGKKEPGKTKTQRINVNVVGKRAGEIVAALLEKYDFTNGVKSENNPDGHPPISAVFTIGDLWADAYMSGDKPRGAMKGRLISLQHVYVEDERFDKPEVFGEVSKTAATAEVDDSEQEPQQTEASDNQADDESVMQANAEESDRAETERLMAIFVEGAIDSDLISLDSGDPLYKLKVKFLLNNGYAWSDEAVGYVPKTIAA